MRYRVGTPGVLLLGLLAVALGMPFPLGSRVVSARAPELVPWALTLDGFLSVFSSIFCNVLAMSIGSTRVLLVAALLDACDSLALVGLVSGSKPSTSGRYLPS